MIITLSDGIKYKAANKDNRTGEVTIFFYCSIDCLEEDSK
jgi:hypothetical protein